MVLAVEILIGTISLSNLIKDNKTFQIPSLMQTGKNVGMRMLDDSIMELLKQEKISMETACKNANNKAAFEKLFRGKPL